MLELRVPDLTEDRQPVENADVLDVFRSVGDVVEAEEPILMIQTPQAFLNIKASQPCKIEEIHVRDDDLVVPGQLLVKLSVLMEGEGQTDKHSQKEMLEADTSSTPVIYTPSFSRADRTQFDAAAKKDRVFLSFGHNETAQVKLRLLLECLGVEPVELGQQIQNGMTYFETLKSTYADVRAAVCLFTHDDEGYRLSGPDQVPKPRGRQNVVWDAGMFMGRVGAQNVHYVVEKSIEMPSNLAGLKHIRYDETGAWGTRVATNLLRTGVRINMDGLADWIN
ncbi:TIR domain-containing protein [Candidatus Rhodobacter oscarellae]|uniref:TIR domain-containing protein n=1 Tax=Candidatus Rhodobacter oscarellae TaxID=1675527 RepID=UPI000670A737|nr:nucleotide-binding protein [Candidatus Rhodobacter lobularis]